MLFNHLNYNEVVSIGTQVSIFLRRTSMCHLEYERAYRITVSFTNFQGKET